MNESLEALERLVKNWLLFQWVAMGLMLVCSAIFAAGVATTLVIVIRSEREKMMQQIDSRFDALVHSNENRNTVTISSPRTFEDNVRDILRKDGRVE